MKKIFTFVFFLLLAGSHVNALLPPLYESLAEYKALLNNHQFSDKLSSGEQIRDIQKTDKGFIVRTVHHFMVVDVNYEPQDRPGPARFHFVFHDPESIVEK